MKLKLFLLSVLILGAALLWIPRGPALPPGLTFAQQANFPPSSGGLPANLTFVAPTLTVSAAGFGNGALALSGNTSGVATCTAPAIAGTSTNPVTCSNVFQFPAGASGTPALQLGSAVDGFYEFGTHQVGVVSNGFVAVNFNGSDGFDLNSGTSVGWCASGGLCTGGDVQLGRSGIGILEIAGAGATPGQGRLKAAGYIATGTTFTSNAGCGDTTLTGGATAGKYTSVTAGTCTTIITMGNTATAPNGWSCTATDLTTIADTGNIKQSATTATTASLNETTVAASDVIQFSCVGY